MCMKVINKRVGDRCFIYKSTLEQFVEVISECPLKKKITVTNFLSRWISFHAIAQTVRIYRCIYEPTVAVKSLVIPFKPSISVLIEPQDLKNPLTFVWYKYDWNYEYKSLLVYNWSFLYIIHQHLRAKSRNETM